MGRIKIKDLPKEMKISRQDLRRITGGNVSANGSMIATKGDGGAVNLLDVCKTPGIPAPIPVPYSSDIATKSSGTTKSTGTTKDETSGPTSRLTYNLAYFSDFIIPALDE